MKTSGVIFALLAAFSISSNVKAQGVFQNLNFESAIISAPRDAYGRIDFSTALPGWTGYCGTQLQTLVTYNNQFLDSAGISLLSSNYPYGPSGIVNGNYYVLLQGGYLLNGPYDMRVSTSLSQAAQINSLAKSLRFNAYDAPEVSFAGTPLPLIVLSAFPNYNIYGADISQFAGQTGELRFTSGFTFLDRIQFSTQTVPEPSLLALASMGLVMLCYRLRRKA